MSMLATLKLKPSPACAGPIFIGAHFGYGETGDYRCPSCGADLKQVIKPLGRWLLAGMLIGFIAGALTASPMLMIAGAGLACCLWCFGYDFAVRS